MIHSYDRTSKWSILEYSKRLLNKTLEEAIIPDQIEEEFRGKGRLGQLVEKYFFGYEINSNQEADFSEAGLELKCTPLVKGKVDFPQIGFEKGTTERGFSKVSKSV